MLARPFAIVCIVLLSGCEYSIPQKTVDGRGGSSLNQQDVQSPHLKNSDYVVAEPELAENLTGINGGDRFLFEPTQYRGEVTIGTNSDLVRFFVLDDLGEKNVAVNAESFYIKSGDNQIFMLDPDNDDGSTSANGGSACSSYSLEDRNLALAMNSQVEVVMSIQGRSYRASLDISNSTLSIETDSTVAD